MSFPRHVQWVVDHMGGPLDAELRRQGERSEIQRVVDVLCEADPSPRKVAVQWMAERLIDGGFLWEDVSIGVGSKVHETLVAFTAHRGSMPSGNRDLGSHKTLASAWKAVAPFLVPDGGEDAPGIRERRRRERAAAHAQSIILCDRPGLTVAVPLTEAASKWWGRGTRWCTAAENGNAFDSYNDRAPLVVVLSPDAKFQMQCTSHHTVIKDASDATVTPEFVAERWDIFEVPVRWAFGIDASLLAYIPEPLRDRETCLKAVGRNGRVLQWVPESLRDRETCLKAVREIGLALQWVPESLRDREMCLKAVRDLGRALQWVPDALRDRRICLLAARQSFCSLDATPLLFVPENLRQRKIYAAAVSFDGRNLETVPKEMINRRLCAKAVRADGLSLRYVPQSLRSRRMCIRAVRDNGNALSSVPDALVDKRICRLATRHEGNALMFVPEPLRDRKVYLNAVSDGVSLAHIPLESRDRGTCLRALKRNYGNIRFVPKSILDRSMCQVAVSECFAAIEHVPHHLIDRDLCLMAVAQAGIALASIPIEMRTHEMCLTAVRSDPAALPSVPEELRPQVTAAMDGQATPAPCKRQGHWIGDKNLLELKAMFEGPGSTSSTLKPSSLARMIATLSLSIVRRKSKPAR